VFSQAEDPELGLAVTKAWNDWFFEEWYLEYPNRLVPMGITFLTDPAEGAKEIRRNAARGFTSVSLPERPQRIGLPSLFSGYWDPIVAACAETDTVISLHVGSSGNYEAPEDAGQRRAQLTSTLFGQLPLAACTEWLWSGYPVRYPSIKIAMSEGGIGWVAMLVERLENLRPLRLRTRRDAWLAPGRRAAPKFLVLHDRGCGDDGHEVHHRGGEHLR
jgi:predicted TIM-barrel fold metal-dependent hydrolase